MRQHAQPNPAARAKIRQAEQTDAFDVTWMCESGASTDHMQGQNAQQPPQPLKTQMMRIPAAIRLRPEMDLQSGPSAGMGGLKAPPGMNTRGSWNAE